LIIAVSGWYINKRLKKTDQDIWRNQKLIEKRIEFCDVWSPLLNQLFNYFYFEGDWRTTTPIEVFNIRRRLDSEIYQALPLFSEKFINAYQKFRKLCFEETQSGSKLRTEFTPNNGWTQGRKNFLSTVWISPTWDNLFAPPNDKMHAEKIADCYSELLYVFSAELGFNRSDVK
jgi:hypothetical protein